MCSQVEDQEIGIGVGRTGMARSEVTDANRWLNDII